MPTKVLASRFNTLKARVDKILGPASETNRSTTNYTYGYGQYLGTGTDVVGGNPNTIDAVDYKLLYINIQKIRYHQVGVAAFTAQAYQIGDFVNNANADKVAEAYMAGLESLATNMETDRKICHPSQALLQACDASTSATSWNGEISHIFKVNFSDAQARRQYFNAGGTIRFQPNMSYSGSQAKTVDWKQTLTEIGTVDFGCQGTSVSSGIRQAYGGIGHDYMSAAYQTAYYNAGGGVYNPNRFTIYAMELDDKTLQFKVTFSDPSYGNPDETVLAAVTSDAIFFRPFGQAEIDGSTTYTVYQSLPTSTSVSTL
jgi:hypothetical protein